MLTTRVRSALVPQYIQQPLSASDSVECAVQNKDRHDEKQKEHGRVALLHVQHIAACISRIPSTHNVADCGVVQHFNQDMVYFLVLREFLGFLAILVGFWKLADR